MDTDILDIQPTHMIWLLVAPTRRTFLNHMIVCEEFADEYCVNFSCDCTVYFWIFNDKRWGVSIPPIIVYGWDPSKGDNTTNMAQKFSINDEADVMRNI